MQFDKLAPGLLARLSQVHAQGPVRRRVTHRPLPGYGTLAARDEATPPAVPGAPQGDPPLDLRLFVRCEPNARFQYSPHYKVHGDRGRIRSADATLRGLRALSRHPGVHALNLASRCAPTNDHAAQHARLPQFRHSAHPAWTGENVVIGIVDTGIDTTSPTFAGRIVKLWDQTLPGRGWSGARYGQVLEGEALHKSVDTNGHGTHVAGTAAGRHASHPGVAPAARLVIVKTDFNTNHVGDGIRFVFNVAQALGLPAVVNLSLGSHANAHDGSDDLSDLIDAHSSPGRIVVAAAGNDGQRAMHAETVVPAGGSVDVPLCMPAGSEPFEWLHVQAWYPGRTSLRVQVHGPGGGYSPVQPVRPGHEATKRYRIAHTVVQVTTAPAVTTPNDDHQVLFDFLPLRPLRHDHVWSLRFHNPLAEDLPVHLWIDTSASGIDGRFVGGPVSHRCKIATPGCAARAITVGAYMSRSDLIDLQGQRYDMQQAVGELCRFSSPGPLRNDGPKPDLVAPGALIVSTLASQAPPLGPVVAPGLVACKGTSMAAPFVSGVVALLLQRDDNLDAAAVKQLLQANCRLPVAPFSGYDPCWGHGILDAAGL